MAALAGTDISVLIVFLLAAASAANSDSGSQSINETAQQSRQVSSPSGLHWAYEKDDGEHTSYRPDILIITLHDHPNDRQIRNPRLFVDSELTASDWSKIYPKCSGRRQSPLLINTTSVVRDPTLKNLTLIDYDDAPVGDLWYALRITAKHFPCPVN